MFEPYFEVTELNEAIDVSMIYDTQQRIRNFKLYNDADVEKIIHIYYKNGKQTNADMGRMTSLLKPVLEQIDILDYLSMIRY